MNEEKEEEEEEEEDEDALSWQLPGPRKYSRLNSPSAGDEVEGSIPPGAGRSFDPDDDGAIHEEEEEQEEEEEDDDDEAESGVEAASSRRLVLRRDASRSKAEEEATDAAMALGKVSLGVVPEEDTTAVLAEGDRTRLLEGGTDAEPSDGTSPDDALDKFEGDGDDGPGGNRTRDLSDRDDDEPADAAGAGETTDRKPVNRRPGKSEPEPAAGEVAGSIPPAPAACYFSDSRCPSPVTPSGTCWRRTARWRSCRCGRTVRPGGWSTSTRRARTPRSRRCTRRRFSASSCGCRDFRRTWLGRKQPPRAVGRIRGRNGRGGREGSGAGDVTSVRRITRNCTHTREKERERERH